VKGSTAVVIGFVVLAFVWAYSRHTFDTWLGLATPHGATAGGPDLPIVHTGNGYGKVYAAVVPETGPVTGPTGFVTSMTVTRPDSPGALVAGRGGRQPNGLDRATDGFSWNDGGPLVNARAGRASGGLTPPSFGVIRVTGDPRQSFVDPIDDLVYRGESYGISDGVYRGEDPGFSFLSGRLH